MWHNEDMFPTRKVGKPPSVFGDIDMTMGDQSIEKASRSLQERGLRPGVISRLKLCETPSCRRSQSIIRWTKPDQSSKKLVVTCSTSFQGRFELPVERALTSIQRSESLPNQNEFGRCRAIIIRSRTIPLKSRWTTIQKQAIPVKYINSR